MAPAAPVLHRPVAMRMEPSAARRCRPTQQLPPIHLLCLLQGSCKIGGLDSLPGRDGIMHQMLPDRLPPCDLYGIKGKCRH